MPLEKPKKPTELVPRAFGGIKNNFSDDLQSTGFEPNIPQTYNGDNLNYHLDATGKELDYVETVVDFINQAPVNHIPFVNENNQLDYVDASSLSGGAFDMFDTKIVDHILQGNEAKGWALQGTYVSGALYPDFYLRCSDEKSTATSKSVTLGSSTLTMYINNNGHQFYNIADKSKVDSFFATYGIANFYGVDEENERIFLPRNKYFAIKNPSSSVPVVGNGMTLGITNGTNDMGLHQGGDGGTFSGAVVNGYTNLYGSNVGTSVSTYPITDNKSLGITTDPTKSGVIANTSDVIQPDESKYLYYCVGNTVVNDSEIDAGGLVAQMEQKANIFLDNVLPSSEFKNEIVSWGMPDYKNGIICTTSLGVEQTYTAPSDGMITYSLSAYNNGQAYIKINNQQVQWVQAYSNPDFNSITGSLPVSKNDVIKYFSHYNGAGYNTQNIIFYPLKGAN